MKVVSQKLRDSAEGQQCTMNLVGVCNYDPDTTVLAHLSAGGMGTKCSDLDAAFMCSDCHTAYDQKNIHAGERDFYARRANQRTLSIWGDMGLITVKGQKA